MSRDWNTAYAIGDTPWDKGYAAPPLRDFLQQRRILGKVLVPGCGAGHDVRLLAQQGAEVTGLDIAAGALSKARAFPRAADEDYVLGDLLKLGQVYDAAFDWVVEHTCLCAIEPARRRDYARSIKRVLKPGGNFWALFFRQVPHYKGKGPPYPISALEIDELFAEDFTLQYACVPQQSYPSRPVGCEEVRWMQLCRA